MSPLVTTLDPTDAVGLRQAFDVVAESQAADVPDFPPLCPLQFFGSIHHGWPGGRKVYALGRLGDKPVGFLELALSDADNTTTAEIRIEVLPAHRRRGVGRALLDHAQELARSEGRKHLIGMAVTTMPGGEPRPEVGNPFAEAFGAKVALVDVRRRLTVETLDHSALDKLLDGAHAASAGYTVVGWSDRAPDEYAADAAYLDGRLLTDAPLGDLAFTEAKIDTERFRAQEAARAARGRRQYLTAARDENSGKLVAITAIDVGATSPWHAFQQITLVDPDHRGHRLGALVKVENLRTVLAAEPRLQVIDTWNAAVNSHMIAINESLGFRPVDHWNNWQLSL